MSRLQKKPPAHKRGHPTLQNMNFFYFCGSFLPSRIRIRIRIQITDPDTMVPLNTDPIRIRIRIRNPGTNNYLSGWPKHFRIQNTAIAATKVWYRYLRVGCSEERQCLSAGNPPILWKLMAMSILPNQSSNRSRVSSWLH
jgi:hypothetical protein